MAQTRTELREHYAIERELADRLRAATKMERRRLYGDVYRERSARIAHHPLVRAAGDSTMRARLVLPQTRLLSNFVSSASTFLEIGAGDGAVAKRLAPAVHRSIAIDVTNALDDGAESPANFEFLEFDGFAIPLPDGSVDVAYSNDVVEHLHPDDLADHAIAVRGTLRASGVYVCVTPNRLSGPHDVSRFFGSTPRGFHLREYTVTELRSALLRAGFSTVDVVASVHGRIVSPIMDARRLRPLENVLEPVPQRIRRRVARPLAAIKVIARK